MEDIIGFSLSESPPKKKYNNELSTIRDNLEKTLNNKIIEIQEKYNIVIFLEQNLNQHKEKPVNIKFAIDLNNSNF